MQDIARFGLPTTIAFFTVLYILTAALVASRLQRRKLERLARFREALRNGFQNHAIESLEDLVNVYKGIHGLPGEDQSYKSDLARHLRKQIASLASGNIAIKATEVTPLKQRLTEYLRQIEAENPFASLPSAERTVLEDIRVMIKSQSVDGALRKLEDLGGLIQVRQESIDKLTSINRWSTPLAVIGVVLTIIFGIISLIK